MGEQAQLSGTLTVSPASTGESQFPSGVTSIAFNLNPAQKSFNVGTGGQPINVNSPNAFIAIPGIGAAPGPVTQASLLYFRSNVPMRIRLTYSGDATPYVSYVNGLLIVEVDPTFPVTKVEVQGAGTLEYFVVGNQ